MTCNFRCIKYPAGADPVTVQTSDPVTVQTSDPVTVQTSEPVTCTEAEPVTYTTWLIMTGASLTGYLLYLYVPTCLMQTQTGTFYEKYSGQGNMFVPSSAMPVDTDTVFECARACIRSQPRCIGFTYEEKKFCEILDSLIWDSSTSKNTWISGNE